ncbi:Hypothetical cytosolic protein [Lactobacillus helveticus H10]|nr:Hypothetical cytosolic protein [Lactobacillus helveticus H10]
MRQKAIIICVHIQIFQSTHSQGVRQKQFLMRNYNLDISIHALTRSATSIGFLAL